MLYYPLTISDDLEEKSVCGFMERYFGLVGMNTTLARF